MNELQRQADPNIVIALAGNKCDLESRRAIETQVKTQRRVYDTRSSSIYAKAAQEYADEMGLLFLETSAKTAHNVTELFTQIGKFLPSVWFPTALINSQPSHFTAKRMPLDQLADSTRGRQRGLNARGGVDLNRPANPNGCACKLPLGMMYIQRFNLIICIG